MPSSDYTPTLTDIGTVTRTRTRDQFGAELGTFSDDTYPSGDSVNTLIQNAVGYIEGFAAAGGVEIGDGCAGNAKSAIVYRVAFSIELGFYPEQITGDHSPYDNFKDLYESAINQLARCLGIPEPDDSTGNGGNDQNDDETAIAQFGFPTRVLGMTAWMEGWTIPDLVPYSKDDIILDESDPIMDEPFRMTVVGDGTIYVNGSPLQIMRQPGNYNGSNQIVVAAVSGKKIRVVWANALAGAACILTFKSNTTPISPAYPNGANGGFVFPPDPNGIFETNVGEGLVVDTTSPIALMIGYVEV